MVSGVAGVGGTAGLAAGHAACGAANAFWGARAVGARFRDVAMRGWGAPAAMASGVGLAAWGVGTAMGGEARKFARMLLWMRASKLRLPESTAAQTRS